MRHFAAFRERIVRQRFERIADRYDDTIVRRRAVYNAAVDDLIAAHLRSPGAGSATAREPSVALLDAACGTGSRWQNLRVKVPWAAAWGVDASPSMCRAARRRGGFAAVACAHLTAVPFRDASFDVVACLFHSFCYLTSDRDRRRTLRELRRVLRPGGLLVLDVINLRHRGEGRNYRRGRTGIYWDLVRSYLDVRLAPGDKLYRTPDGDGTLRGYFHGFTHRSLAGLLVGEGFQVERLLTVGYDTGRVHPQRHRGQILAICRRPD